MSGHTRLDVCLVGALLTGLLLLGATNRATSADDDDAATLEQEFFRCVERFEYAEAIRIGERLVALGEQRRDSELVGRAELNLGGAFSEVGELQEATRRLDHATEVLRRQGPGANRALAYVYAMQGVNWARRGAFQRALDATERAERLARVVGDAPQEAYARSLRASILIDLGSPARAQQILDPLLKREDLAPAERLVVELSLGVCAYEEGDYERADGLLTRVAQAAAEAHDGAMGAMARVHLGESRQRQGNLKAAEEAYRDARALAAPGSEEEADALIGLGDVARRSAVLRERGAGDARSEATKKEEDPLKDAENEYETALASARLRELPTAEIDALTGLALLYAQEGRAKEAREASCKGLDLLDLLSQGLSFEAGALTRGRWKRALGARLAAGRADGRPEEMFAALEATRAAVLVADLGSSSALRDAFARREVASLANEARGGLAEADAALRRAVAGGLRQEILDKRAQRDAAREAYLGKIASIERQVRSRMPLPLHDLISLEEARSGLRPHEVLVLYALDEEAPGALVVEPRRARWIPLEKRGVEEAIEQLRLAVGREDDFPAHRDRLRDLLLTPLGLPAATQRLWICPDGAIALVPFQLLLEGRGKGSRPVQTLFIPSATWWRRMAGEVTLRGEHILAVGDPDYAREGRGAFSPLPGTRKEIEDILDETDTRLLDKNATEEALRQKLSPDVRWRAAHFACHGAIDQDIPAFSALALAPDENDDGLLTAMELYRLPLLADLAVLSACDSGTGKTIAGEGLMGLVRPFLGTGTPRVLASLWKVDDEATRVLMKRFYKEWRAGTDAATALQKAQEEVRRHAHPDWSAPRYWAAWVLWGLAEGDASPTAPHR